MATLTFSIDNFYMTSEWTNRNGAMVSRPTQVTAYKTVNVSGIPADSQVTGASFSVAVGSPTSGIDVLKINNQDASGYALSTYTQDVKSMITGNGNVKFTFVFRAYGDASLADGDHQGSLTLSNGTITVEYESGVQPEPEPEPEVVEASERLICLFDKRAKSYKGNGICVLSPISCVVSEIAGGYFELEMKHPMDAHGKWAMIENDSIIRAPVPVVRLPMITLPAASVWQVKSTVTSTGLYTRLPTYTPAYPGIDQVRANPSQYIWNTIDAYFVGDYVIYEGTDGIYRADADIEAGDTRPTNNSKWTYIMQLSATGGGSGSASGGVYDPGDIAEYLHGGELITKIADYSSMYIQVRSLRGIVGYVARGDCEETSGTAIGQTIPPRVIASQAFRVYSIECEDDEHTITVLAKHISYDYQKNALFDCQIVEAEPATAIAIMQGSLINADSRLIACNITGQKITQDWSFQNPIYALLDPDEGLVPTLQAALVRDNDDIFILGNYSHPGPRIVYGVNMTGVQWTRNTEDVITRIVPRCGDGEDGYVYLDELFVDSEYIDDYAVISVEILDCDCYVGQEVKHADGTTQTLTRADCIQQMREKAQKRFSVDKVDAVAISLDVQFVLLGDTEEYKQYRGLQSLYLYDEIQIDTGPSGMSITAQVSGYEWDCIAKRYKQISIGNVLSATKRRIPGYRVNNGAITYSKLAPGLINRIKGVNV